MNNKRKMKKKTTKKQKKESYHSIIKAIYDKLLANMNGEKRRHFL
jgi:hypothetical protein